MAFDEILAQVTALLQRQGRASYRALKLRFNLDDDYLATLKEELIDAQRVAVDEDSKVLVWAGKEANAESENRGTGETEKSSLASSVQRLEPEGQRRASTAQTLDSRLRDTRPDAAERRQLTVMFCDLVGSTMLSEQLDPEEYREVVRTYQDTCTMVIRRYAGHLAQHLGDGLLVYFGYPAAHEDEAQRAVRTALGIVEAIQHLSFPTIALPRPLQVRIGIHTGLVVIGEIGSSEKREVLAMGETPNLAARLQGLADPATVVVSATTQRLAAGLFEYQALGPQALKGFSVPLSVYRVVKEKTAQSRFEAAVSAGLTPLVGREEELGLLQQRWAQAKQGAGQVVLLSGEPGIGKSRLVQELKEQLVHDGARRVEFHCSPYHQNSALYPVIDHLQRLLQFTREDTPAAKLEKLQQTLARYRFPQADTVPLLATLLSLPHPEGYAPLTMSPQKQKEKTQTALVAWLREEAAQRPVYTVWEDLHWADPSTLEVLTLLLDQVPTTRLLVLLTSRPEFTSPWGSRSYLTQLTLNRLGQPQVEAMVKRVAGGKALSSEIVQQIVSKTDGVPLFVEELTKSIMESRLDVGAQHAAPVSLSIPSTLQDSLMARLDRLGPAKEIAQLGATLGREFSYELLHTIANRDEDSLQHGLKQLVEAELLYQRGLLPQAQYLFKHALIQDSAYQSLLKSRRQQLHQQIAQVLETQFSDTKETQPELLAHHYTEAGLLEQAIPYWQKAGERATQRSAYVEAGAHLTRGLELFKILPDTSEHSQQELTLQLALNEALLTVKGYAAPEVEQTALRAQELCRRLGETPHLIQTLLRLCSIRFARAEYSAARELAEQCLNIAHRAPSTAFLPTVHFLLSNSLYALGEFALAYDHQKQSIALSELQKDAQSLPWCLSWTAWTLWHLGYADQALERSQDALALVEGQSQPFNRAYALVCAAKLHLLRREESLARERAEEVITLSTEQGFPYWLANGMIYGGRALIEQEEERKGIEQLRQGLAVMQATSTKYSQPYYLALLAEAYSKGSHIETGLAVLAEALAIVDKTGERTYEAELYRLKGKLLLAQASKLSD